MRIMQEPPQRPLTHQVHDWYASPPGYLKFNVDVVFSSANHNCGLGICIRDEWGGFKGAQTISRDFVSFVPQGLALALYDVVLWLKNKNNYVRKTIKKIDYQHVSTILFQKKEDMYVLGSTVLSILL